MIGQVRRWLPQAPRLLVTDGGLIAVKLGWRCLHFHRPVTFVWRLPLNIRLFDPPPPSRRKNASKVGKRQATLQARLEDEKTAWNQQPMAWYSGKQRLVEWVSGVGLWQTPSENEPLPIRWVLVRDPLGR